MSNEIEGIREEIMELVHRWSGDDQLSVFADPVDRLIAKLAAAQAELVEYAGTMCHALEINAPGEDAVKNREQVADAIRTIRSDFSAAQATIQQQARELEEWASGATRLRAESGRSRAFIKHMEPLIARHSARAQQEQK